jgi:hypothetical protein
MCRGKDHGNRRCPHDTSEARKRRRRASQGRELYKKPVFTDPDDYNAVIADTKPRSIKELRKESLLINALLHTPVNKDPAVQAEIDAKNEILVTRLGYALGAEAERRSGFDHEEFSKEMSYVSDAYMEAASAVGAARRERDRIKKELEEALNAESTTLEEEKENDKEIIRIKKLFDEALRVHKPLQKIFEVEGDRYSERREMLQKEAIAKILPAYKSVIADIRPVGGTIDNHELSNDDAVETMQRTVGKHYPSEWIEASQNNGPVAIVSDDNVRAYYNAHKQFPGVNVPGMATCPEFYTQAIIPQVDSEEAYRKLSEGNPGAVLMEGKPLDFEGNVHEYRYLKFPVRHPFDGYVDVMDENGKPVGEGWKYGYVLDSSQDVFNISDQKTWYRDEVSVVPEMRSISIPTSTHPDADGHAYHEAVHSFEDSVGDGRMMGRIEEAFLKRRSSIDGVQTKLRNITASQNILEMEFARTQSGLIHNYMGKEYTDQVIHREVLSTGAETLFEGRYGAFMGLRSLYKQDLDHRAFTLGMFASA